MAARAPHPRPLRVLLVTRGSAGHVLPLALFGRACAAAGHEVTVAAQRAHRGNVERTGLSFAPLDGPADEDWMPLLGAFARTGVDDAHAVQISEFFARLDLRAALPGLQEIVTRLRPDLMLRDSWEFASTVVAEAHAVPLARVGLGLAAVEEETIRLAALPVDGARRDAGLPPDPRGDRMRDSPYLTVVPAPLEDPGATTGRATHRFRAPRASGLPPPPLPPATRAERRPLVHLTFGSVAPLPHLPYFPDLYRAAIDGLTPLPVDVLVTVGAARDPAELGPVPENVSVERWVDLDAVAARADVIVGHGGYGTTLTALAHGVPQVILPLFSGDQWANAAAVTRTGAGLSLDADRATRTVFGMPARAQIDGLAEAVRTVLSDDSHRRRAQVIAGAMAALPPVDAAVAVLERIAAGTAA